MWNKSKNNVIEFLRSLTYDEYISIIKDTVGVHYNIAYDRLFSEETTLNEHAALSIVAIYNFVKETEKDQKLEKG